MEKNYFIIHFETDRQSIKNFNYAKHYSMCTYLFLHALWQSPPKTLLLYKLIGLYSYFTDTGDSSFAGEMSLDVSSHRRRSREQVRPLGGSNKPVSELIIENVGSEHSGNYSCAPENSAPSTVTVYVLRGKCEED